MAEKKYNWDDFDHSSEPRRPSGGVPMFPGPVGDEFAKQINEKKLFWDQARENNNSDFQIPQPQDVPPSFSPQTNQQKPQLQEIPPFLPRPPIRRNIQSHPINVEDMEATVRPNESFEIVGPPSFQPIVPGRSKTPTPITSNNGSPLNILESGDDFKIDPSKNIFPRPVKQNPTEGSPSFPKPKPVFPMPKRSGGRAGRPIPKQEESHSMTPVGVPKPSYGPPKPGSSNFGAEKLVEHRKSEENLFEPHLGPPRPPSASPLLVLREQTADSPNSPQMASLPELPDRGQNHNQNLPDVRSPRIMIKQDPSLLAKIVQLENRNQRLEEDLKEIERRELANQKIHEQKTENQINELMSQINELERQSLKLSDENENYARNSEILRSQFNEVNQELAVKEKSNTHLRSALGNAMGSSVETQNLKAEIEKLNSVILQKDSEMEDYYKECAGFFKAQSEANDHKTSQLNFKLNESMTLKEDLIQIKSDFDNANKQAEFYFKKYEAFVKKSNQEGQKREEVQRNLASTTKDLENVRKELQRVSDDKQNQTIEVRRLEADSNNLQERLAIALSEKDHAIAQVKDYKDYNASAQDCLKMYSVRRREVEEQLNMERHKFDDQKKELDGIKEELEEKISCRICMDEYNDDDHYQVVLSCGHPFGNTCVKTSLARRKQCPTCNKEAHESHIKRVYLQ